jgi:eukaryotic-like serine/threonine-protein kinase
MSDWQQESEQPEGAPGGGMEEGTPGGGTEGTPGGGTEGAPGGGMEGGPETTGTEEGGQTS